MKKFLSSVALASLCSMPGFAQEAEPGGVFYTLDLEQLFEASSDRDLATAEEESGLESLTSLNFGIVSETRSQRLSFDVGTGIRVTSEDLTFDDNTARLAYSRNSADALLELSAEFARADIAFLRDITDFIDGSGMVVLPDDLDELTGTGIRSTTTLSAGLVWGETAPLGYSLGLSSASVRYEDASAALVDSDTVTLDAGVRLNFNEVTTGNVILEFARAEDVGGDPEDSVSLGAGVTFDRPLGGLTFRVVGTRDELDETFWSAFVDRELAFPDGSFAVTVGVVEDDLGDPQFVGELTYVRALAVGELAFNTTSTQSAGDALRTLTAQASYERELSPVSGMRIGFDYGQTEDADTGELATGGVSAIYSRDLTPLWEMNVGARTDVRTEDGDRRQSNTVFVSFDRTLSWRR